MKGWKERLHKERAELMVKYEKLCHFLATASLPKEHTKLLSEQKCIMYSYLLVLEARIKL